MPVIGFAGTPGLDGWGLALDGPDCDRLVAAYHAHFSVAHEAMEQPLGRHALGANPGHELVGHHDLGVHLAGEPLQPARHVDRVADHEVVEPLPVADAAHDGFAVVGADPDLHREFPARHALGAPAAWPGRQVHGTAEGPGGIGAAGGWRPERRHDRIANVLFKRAPMLEDDARHALVKPL